MKLDNQYLELFFSDFSNSTYSPQSCGYDESSGEDKICCGDLNGERVITPQYPKFPQQNLAEARWFSVGIFKYKPGYKSHDLL